MNQTVELVLETSSPEDTKALAAALAAVVVDGDVIVLTGDLGAGKTCFTQGLGAGLGIEDRMTSPTFTLANRYHGRLTLNHLDVYRLESVAETLDLGLSELFEDGVTVIEWGDRIEETLPSDHLLLKLRYPDLPAEVADEAALNRRVIDVVIPAAGSFRSRQLAEVLDRWVTK